MSKLCIDCKHHRRVPRLFGVGHLCFVKGDVNIVDGTPLGEDCAVKRTNGGHPIPEFIDDGYCGVAARFFELKPKTELPLPNQESSGKEAA